MFEEAARGDLAASLLASPPPAATPTPTLRTRSTRTSPAARAAGPSRPSTQASASRRSSARRSVNTWSAGGADGNGYIRTQFGSVATTLAGTSTGIWDSPAFTYNGLKGKAPGSVTFDMNILRNVAALLDLSLLNDAQYRVDLVDQGSGNRVSVVPRP